MKELIGSVVFIACMAGASNAALWKIHDAVRRAALEHVAKGMPSLTQMTAALRGEKPRKTGTRVSSHSEKVEWRPIDVILAEVNHRK